MQASSLVLAACLHSCCECNCNKGNLKSLISKNTVYFYTKHCAQRGSGHLQTIARTLSSDPQVPSPGAWLSLSAQSPERSMLAAQHMMLKVTSCPWIWDLKLLLPPQNPYFSLYLSPNGFCKNISTPWNFSRNLWLSCVTGVKMDSAFASFFCVWAVKL